MKTHTVELSLLRQEKNKIISDKEYQIKGLEAKIFQLENEKNELRLHVARLVDRLEENGFSHMSAVKRANEILRKTQS